MYIVDDSNFSLTSLPESIPSDASIVSTSLAKALVINPTVDMVAPHSIVVRHPHLLIIILPIGPEKQQHSFVIIS